MRTIADRISAMTTEQRGALTDQFDKASRIAGAEPVAVIGIGCPGLIREDGSIEAGAQNLPGNWESSRFNLAHAICRAIPEIGRHETVVVIHNDAVVQGLAIKRLGSNEDCVNVCDFFMSPASDNITGQVLYLGGIS